MHLISDAYKTFTNNVITKLSKTYTWLTTSSSSLYTCGGLCSYATGNSFSISATGTYSIKISGKPTGTGCTTYFPGTEETC